MSEFLLEIYSEEIPARMQSRAAEDFRRLFLDILGQKANFDENQIQVFISPRRLSASIQNLDKFQVIEASQKIGPKANANNKAIEGFAKSVSCKIQDLKIIQTPKGEYYSFSGKKTKNDTLKIISEDLPKVLNGMSRSWPKSMIWNSQVRWVRPIRSILAIFDEKVVSFEFAGIKSGKITYGHNTLSKKELIIKNFKDYEEKLKKNFVTINQESREVLVVKKINEICQKHKLRPVDNLDENNPLLKETVGLSEFPNVGIGEIGKEFMLLPKEILILTAKLHQKYFCLEDSKGNLAPYFIFVSNVKITDKIIKDNQKVLRARLSDAKFFIDEDLKTSFVSRIENLKQIIFHEKLGTIHDKVKRLEVLTKFTALWIPNADFLIAERLSDLAKNDLTTKCVAELPELQGVVGGYYAKMQGEDQELSDAIAEHYLPLGPNSPIPSTPLGSLLSLCDKIDTICGLFLVDEKPTSSKDPLALRRAALGIVRIIITNNISVPLRIIVEKSINSFPNSTIKNNPQIKSGKELKQVKKESLYEVIEFIVERMKSILKDYYQVRPDIANALLDDYMDKIKEDRKFDINKLVKKAIFINGFVTRKSNSSIISLYKRAVNIVSIEEKKDGKKYNHKPHSLAMRDRHEKVLYKKAKNISSRARKLGRAGSYEEIFDLFHELEQPLNSFFDNIKVNVDESNVRENRLLILGSIKNLFNGIFDFSKIEK